MTEAAISRQIGDSILLVQDLGMRIVKRIKHFNLIIKEIPEIFLSLQQELESLLETLELISRRFHAGGFEDNTYQACNSILGACKKQLDYLYRLLQSFEDTLQRHDRRSRPPDVDKLATGYNELSNNPVLQQTASSIADTVAQLRSKISTSDISQNFMSPENVAFSVDPVADMLAFSHAFLPGAGRMYEGQQAMERGSDYRLQELERDSLGHDVDETWLGRLLKDTRNTDDEIVLAVMGTTGSGKTTFSETASGYKGKSTIGHSLSSG
jgi:hypothetical protein